MRKLILSKANLIICGRISRKALRYVFMGVRYEAPNVPSMNADRMPKIAKKKNK